MNKPVLVVMAAGMGSRYGGMKQIDPVGPCGQVIVDYSLYDARRAGFETVIFVIKHEIEEAFKAAIGDRVSRVMDVKYAFQQLDELPEGYTIPEGRVKPWGTCHAVLAAKPYIHGPFAVINADDYYGVDAYRTIYEELQRLPERGAATMVGYLLKNTVTRYGTVSRGVCHARDGYLTDIHETLKIRLRDDGTIGDEDSGVLLEPDTVVSMNFWGLMPSVFDEMERYFEDFLRRDAGENAKAECLLPNMVGKLLKEGRLSVSVLQSKDRWFGMTYHEDRARVAAELLELHREGIYPRELR